MRLVLLTSIFLLVGAFASFASAQGFGQPCTANYNCLGGNKGNYCDLFFKTCWPCEAKVLGQPFACNQFFKDYLPGTCGHCGGTCDSNNFCRK